MNRRDFITLLGGAAAAWPLAARAQQPAKLPTIGFLGGTSPSVVSQSVAAFVQRLHELGWVEGRNVTGLSVQNSDLAGKRVELLREVVPGLRLAVMANVGYAGAVQEMGEAQAAARMFGLEVVTLEIQRAEDIAPAFEALKGRAEALYVCAEPLVTANRVRISTLANVARLPTMHGQREHVEAGGLMSYAANFPDLYRRSADLVDKILRGTNPGDIPVEQPTKFDLVINLTTAKALGLTIPDKLMALAEEVIE